MSLRPLAADIAGGLWAQGRCVRADTPQARAAARTVLAVILAVVTVYEFRIAVDHAYWAAISAVVVMQATAGASLFKGAMRFAGTALALILIIPLGAVLADAPGLLVATAALVITGALLAGDLFAGPGARMLVLYVAVTFAIVCLAGVAHPGDMATMARDRTALVLVGTLAAWLVNLVLTRPAGADLDGLAGDLTAAARDLAGHALVTRRDPAGFDARRAAFDQARARFDARLADARVEHAVAFDRATWFHLLGSRLGQVRDVLVMVHHQIRAAEAEVADLADLAAGLDAALAALDDPDRRAAALAALDQSLADHRQGLVAELAATPGPDAAIRLQVVAGLDTVVDLLEAPWTPAPGGAGPTWSDRLGQLRPSMIEQALKAGLVVLVVPYAWLLLDLPAFSAMVPGMVVSTVVVTQVDFLSTLRKGLLRIAGALGGGLAGLALIGLGLTDLVPWLIALALLLAVGAWIQHGPADIAYAGLQWNLALVITAIAGDVPATSILPPIDRLAGVLAGVGALAMVNVLIWPDSPRRRLERHFRVDPGLISAVLAALADDRPAAARDALARHRRSLAAARANLAWLQRHAILAGRDLSAVEARLAWERVATADLVVLCHVPLPADLKPLLRRMAASLAASGTIDTAPVPEPPAGAGGDEAGLADITARAALGQLRRRLRAWAGAG